MKSIKDLHFGFSDAVNYRSADAQHLLNLFFVEDAQIARICEPQISFLVGEKGTGKTACAAFLSGSSGSDSYSTQGKMVFLLDNDYDGFRDVVQRRALPDPSYPQIWKIVLMLLLIDHVRALLPESDWPEQFNAVVKAIDLFYAGAFNSEVYWALQFVADAHRAAECLAKTSTGDHRSHLVFSDSQLLSSILFVEKSLSSAIKAIRTAFKVIMFVDGIDVRPSRMEYVDFIKSVKALVNAVWSLNEDLRRSAAQLPPKFVLLVRPDILDTVGMQNLNNRMRDNAVMLDWQTTYQNYNNSKLFQLAERMLASQQDPSAAGPGVNLLWWNRYFPYKVWNNRHNAPSDSSFIPFLRSSFYRPRDIITYLDIMRVNKVERGTGDETSFTEKDFNDSSVRRRYSEYLLGEVKDSLQFYYASADYELFLKFFAYLAPSMTKDHFKYENFASAYSDLMTHIRSSGLERPIIFQSADTFLQFLYELNIICYVEPNTHHVRGEVMRWCFRERSYANIRPKVRSHQKYKMHYGIARALNAAY